MSKWPTGNAASVLIWERAPHKGGAEATFEEWSLGAPEPLFGDADAPPADADGRANGRVDSAEAVMPVIRIVSSGFGCGNNVATGRAGTANGLRCAA